MAMPTVGTAAPALGNWEMEYNGLTLGLGNPVGIISVEGLDLPPIQTGDVQRARDHGEQIGLDAMGGRDITITGDFVAATGFTLAQTSVFVANAFTNYAFGGTTEFPLWFQLPDLPCLASMCRTRKRTVTIDLAYSMGLADYSVSLHATDPRLYAQPKVVSTDRKSVV